MPCYSQAAHDLGESAMRLCLCGWESAGYQHAPEGMRRAAGSSVKRYGAGLCWQDGASRMVEHPVLIRAPDIRDNRRAVRTRCYGKGRLGDRPINRRDRRDRRHASIRKCCLRQHGQRIGSKLDG